MLHSPKVWKLALVAGLRLRWFFVSVLCLLLVCVCGCSYNGTADSAVASELEPEKTVENDVAIYEHDFGLIRPGNVVSHRFEIVNTANVPWAVSEILTDCACAVPAISTEIIQPGESATVDVIYRAGKSEGNDRRNVHIVFADPGPTIPLTVRAKIREPISIARREVVLETLYQHKGREYYVEVRNYDERPWDFLQLTTEADWFAVESHKLTTIPSEVGLQEIWRVAITPNTRHLKPDWYQEMLEVSANGQTRAIPIRLRVLSKLEIRPEQLFFGIVEPDSVTKRTLFLRFRDDIKPQVEVSTDLGDAVSWKWLKQEYPLWMLEVGLTTGSDAGMITGVLALKFSDADIDDKNISIKAMVRR